MNIGSLISYFGNAFPKKKKQGVNTQTASDNGLQSGTGQQGLDPKPKWYNNEMLINAGDGIGSAIGTGLINFSTINNSVANDTIKNMAKADAGVDALASGLSVIGPWGSAAGLALKGLNTLGSGLISTPAAYKNFALNNNVAASASMGGIASRSADMAQTIDSFKQSGFFGKLFGKKSSDTRKANDLMQKQSDAMNILDDNKKAFEQATTSTDLFSTRNQFNLNGLNNFRSFQIGKEGLKFKNKMSNDKEVNKAQDGWKFFTTPARRINKQTVITAKNKEEAEKIKKNSNSVAQPAQPKSKPVNVTPATAAKSSPKPRPVSGNAPKAINVADNKNRKFSPEKAAEFKQWKADQANIAQTQPQQTQQAPVRNYYNPAGYLEQPQQLKAQNVVPTKTPTSTQASIPVQGKTATAVKPVGTVQAASKPMVNQSIAKTPVRSANKQSETVSDLWQKVTGTSWAEAKMQGLTDGSLRNNLDILKRLKAGENPLETMRLAKEQEEADKKKKITLLANAAIQRSMNASLTPPVINTSEGSDTVLTSLKKGGSISEKKCLKPKLKRSKRVEA